MNTSTSMMTTGMLDPTNWQLASLIDVPPPPFRFDDGTKDESALPFHIHLSLALRQLTGTSVEDGDDWDEEDSDYLGPTPKWLYCFYDDGLWFPP